MLRVHEQFQSHQDFYSRKHVFPGLRISHGMSAGQRSPLNRDVMRSGELAQ